MTFFVKRNIPFLTKIVCKYFKNST